MRGTGWKGKESDPIHFPSPAFFSSSKHTGVQREKKKKGKVKEKHYSKGVAPTGLCFMTILSLGPKPLKCVLTHTHSLFCFSAVKVYAFWSTHISSSGPRAQEQPSRGRKQSLEHREQGKAAPQGNHRRGSRKGVVLSHHWAHKQVRKK